VITGDTEPEILADFDRSSGGSERLLLERGEWRGRPVYRLRIVCQNAERQWSSAPAKADSDGQCWAALPIRARELRELGLALVAEAEEEPQVALPNGAPRRETPVAEPKGQGPATPIEGKDPIDVIPF